MNSRKEFHIIVENWKGTDENDLGIVLAKLFIEILDNVHSRLNKIPEKHFIEFLNQLNLKLIAPTASKTPIVFFVI